MSMQKAPRAALGVITTQQNVEQPLVQGKKPFVRRITHLVNTVDGEFAVPRASGKRKRQEDEDEVLYKKPKLSESENSSVKAMTENNTFLIVPAAPCDQSSKNDANQFPEYATMITKFYTDTDKASFYNYLNDGRSMNQILKQSYQTQVMTQVRGLMMNWIVEIAGKFGNNNETLFRSIMIFDRYLATTTLPARSFHVYALAAFMIATKYEEGYPPSPKDLQRITQNQVSVEELMDAEVNILNALSFDMGGMTPINHLLRVSRLIGLPEKYVHFASYLLELAACSGAVASSSAADAALLVPSEKNESPLIAYPGAQVAAAVVHLVCRTFKADLAALGVRVPVLMEVDEEQLPQTVNMAHTDSKFVSSNGNATGVALPLLRPASGKCGGKFTLNPAKLPTDPVNDEGRPENWGPFLESHVGFTKAEILEVEVRIAAIMRAIGLIDLSVVQEIPRPTDESMASMTLEEQQACKDEFRRLTSLRKEKEASVPESLRVFINVRRKYASEALHQWGTVNFG